MGVIEKEGLELLAKQFENVIEELNRRKEEIIGRDLCDVTSIDVTISFKGCFEWPEITITRYINVLDR